MDINTILTKMSENSAGSLASRMKIKSEVLRIKRDAESFRNDLLGRMQDEITRIDGNLNCYGPCTQVAPQVSDEDKKMLMDTVYKEYKSVIEKLPEMFEDFFGKEGMDSADAKSPKDDDSTEPVIQKEITIAVEKPDDASIDQPIPPEQKYLNY